MTENGFRLYQRPGAGSAIVELQLAYYGLPVSLIDAGDPITDALSLESLLAVNPLGQVPVLQLPSGHWMTESAAMTLYLADVTGSTDLVPGPAEETRAEFLRWLIFIVANIYPTFTYKDAPSRFVDDDRDVPGFVENVLDYATELWRVAAAQADAAGGPWFLGQRFSALDLYIAVMVNWSPRRGWFAQETPGLLAIADAVEAMPQFAPVLARNFAEDGPEV